jgi:hypothetical protein
MEAAFAFIITRTVRPGLVRGYGAKPYQEFWRVELGLYGLM